MDATSGEFARYARTLQPPLFTRRQSRPARLGTGGRRKICMTGWRLKCTG